MYPKHIKFEMSSQEKREAKNYFYLKFGLPGIIGAVDGTHIQMVRPVKDEHLFFNRKLKHSINAMVICDHNMYSIRAVNGVYGGAVHDAHVCLSNERQYMLSNYQNGDKSSWLIGDSGYPLEPWLLTPYRNAEENSLESLYNEKFTKARSIIERVFGILKSRFRCLLAGRELRYAPKKVVKILNVCCALHNMCLIYNVAAPTVIETNEERSNLALPNVDQKEFSRIAQTIRDRIKISLRS
ncbi:putative nuclease HARBI1 [Bactrocera neohumeralis]|uniref:putative nuclease HARBI1 n=1 Tax=Bactrocera neohumeralis TaxID=98809 RepID=UPI002165FCB5|nr:putative nuclease HARBI1 [Bactrocera neohumeralis]